MKLECSNQIRTMQLSFEQYLTRTRAGFFDVAIPQKFDFKILFETKEEWCKVLPWSGIKTSQTVKSIRTLILKF